MKSKIKATKYLTKIFETKSDTFSEWFGYYNYDTLNYNQTRMLCNRSKVDGVAPIKGMTIELGYYDIPSGRWHHIGESDSWNWQQGAMMQWLPGKGNENKVIYNTSNNGHLISIIHDIESGENKQINWAIYGITPDGKKSITLDLERSYWCRAYHYASVANKEKDGRIYHGDGIFELDLVANTRKRIISIDEIINTNYEEYFSNQKHWVEHIMISPDGKQFCFLHRFSPIDNVLRYETRLFIANIDGSNLQIIKDWEKFQWSHFGWKSENEFAIYTQTPYRYANNGGVRHILKNNAWNIGAFAQALFYSLTSRLPFELSSKIYGKIHCYQMYRSYESGLFSLSKKLGSHILDIDGHPSFLKEKYLITDSYPDKKGNQRLIIVNTENNKELIVAEFFAYYKGNPASCDLHPKLCRNGLYVVVDTAFNERHHMMMFEFNWEIIKSKIG